MAAKQRPPATVATVAASGDRAAALRALRDLLAQSLLEAEPSQRAPLARQLRDTMAELDALPDSSVRSASDDLAARRSARRSAAAAAGASAGAVDERG